MVFQISTIEFNINNIHHHLINLMLTPMMKLKLLYLEPITIVSINLLAILDWNITWNSIIGIHETFNKEITKSKLTFFALMVIYILKIF